MWLYSDNGDAGDSSPLDVILLKFSSMNGNGIHWGVFLLLYIYIRFRSVFVVLRKVLDRTTDRASERARSLPFQCVEMNALVALSDDYDGSRMMMNDFNSDLVYEVFVFATFCFVWVWVGWMVQFKFTFLSNSMGILLDLCDFVFFIVVFCFEKMS